VIDSAHMPALQFGAMLLRPIVGEHLMVVRVEAPAGSHAPAHAHPHEQFTLVVNGRLRFRVGPVWYEVKPYDLVHIPSGTEHEAVALEDSLFFDIFHPVREDFLDRLKQEGKNSINSSR